MATSAKSKASSQKIQKSRKTAPRGTKIVKGPTANAPASSGQAIMKMRRTEAGYMKARNTRLAKIRGPLSETGGVKKLSRGYIRALGVSTYFGVAAGILDPQALRTQCGLRDEDFLVGIHGGFADFVRKMKPRDPLEELAIQQLLVNHARVLSLARKASRQTGPKMIKVLNEVCDGASNSFRRLMAALAEYRKPTRQQAVVAIEQANLQTNVAAQQIVQNLSRPDARGKNCERTRNQDDKNESFPKKLPANPEGS